MDQTVVVRLTVDEAEMLARDAEVVALTTDSLEISEANRLLAAKIRKQVYSPSLAT